MLFSFIWFVLFSAVSGKSKAKKDEGEGNPTHSIDRSPLCCLTDSDYEVVDISSDSEDEEEKKAKKKAAKQVGKCA